MATYNIAISRTWTKLAASTDSELLVTFDLPVSIEVASTLTDVVPTVIGHTLSRESAITRAVLGAGFVWARTCVGAIPAAVTLVVSK